MVSVDVVSVAVVSVVVESVGGGSVVVESVVVESVDGGTLDVESVDGGTLDVESVDGGTLDVESVDGGTLDVEPVEGGTPDVESVDGEPVDGGTVDEESVDGEPAGTEPVGGALAGTELTGTELVPGSMEGTEGKEKGSEGMVAGIPEPRLERSGTCLAATLESLDSQGGWPRFSGPRVSRCHCGNSEKERLTDRGGTDNGDKKSDDEKLVEHEGVGCVVISWLLAWTGIHTRPYIRPLFPCVHKKSSLMSDPPVRLSLRTVSKKGISTSSFDGTFLLINGRRLCLQSGLPLDSFFFPLSPSAAVARHAWLQFAPCLHPLLCLIRSLRPHPLHSPPKKSHLQPPVSLPEGAH